MIAKIMDSKVDFKIFKKYVVVKICCGFKLLGKKELGWVKKI